MLADVLATYYVRVCTWMFAYNPEISRMHTLYKDDQTMMVMSCLGRLQANRCQRRCWIAADGCTYVTLGSSFSKQHFCYYTLFESIWFVHKNVVNSKHMAKRCYPAGAELSQPAYFTYLRWHWVTCFPDSGSIWWLLFTCIECIGYLWMYLVCACSVHMWYCVDGVAWRDIIILCGVLVKWSAW